MNGCMGIIRQINVRDSHVQAFIQNKHNYQSFLGIRKINFME